MRRIIFKVLNIVFGVLLLFPNMINIYALQPLEVPADGKYHVIDFGKGANLGEFDSYAEAYIFYNDVKDDFDNTAIVKDTKTYIAEYGILLINTNEACDFDFSFVNAYSGESNSVNGCYGKDAAYITTDETGTKVEFMISGVIGWGDLNDVEIIPLQSVPARLTMYLVQNGILYHEIKTEVDDDYYAYIVDTGIAPEYLEEGKSYYSYDGHYFYTDDSLYGMCDDYKGGVHVNSVNPEDPYYDYYQFLSHRTVTKISEDELQAFFENIAGIHDCIDEFSDNDKNGVDDTLSRSQFYGTIPAFYQYQYEYGANALMLVSLSELESDTGRSALSYTRNNLYAHAAYDNEEEASVSRYKTVNNSIYSHAKYYISGSYCSPLKSVYYGGFFGNKSSGMNVKYSNDPYWGEKAASYYRFIDDSFNNIDLNSYSIAIRTGFNETPVYRYPDANEILYETGNLPDMAFVVLGEISNEEGEWYAVQSEATLDKNSDVDLAYNYDFSNHIGYIKKNDVQLVIPAAETMIPEYVTVNFDADGGYFPGGEQTVKYTLPKGNKASISIPEKDNALFSGWDQNISQIDSDVTVKAVYRDVDSIELSSLPKTDYELNDRISLKGGIVTVHFTDGSSESTELTSSMISGFDMSKDGTQTVNVHYAGCDNAYEISVSEELDNLRADIKTEVLDVIRTYTYGKEITDEFAQRVIDLKIKIDENMQPYLTQTELRQFDEIARLAFADKVNYIVEKNRYNLGVSGLCVSVPLGDSLTKDKFYSDTYRIRVKKGVESKAKTAFEPYAQYNNNTIREMFTITLLQNMNEYDTNGPLLFTIKKPGDSAAGDVFSVLYYAEDGDVEECYTRQTGDAITFMADNTGNFAVISRRTSNQYIGADPVETVTAASSSFDMEKSLTLASVIAALLFGIAVFIIFRFLRIKKKRDFAKAYRHKKKRLEDSENLDVTQAIEIINTQILNLSDIANAEQDLKEDEDD